MSLANVCHQGISGSGVMQVQTHVDVAAAARPDDGGATRGEHPGDLSAEDARGADDRDDTAVQGSGHEHSLWVATRYAD